MNKTLKKALLTGAALSLAATTFAADAKLGFIDLKKVFEKYYKTVQSGAANREEITEIEKERKEMFDARTRRREEWQGLLDKANDQAVSSQERDRSKEAAEKKLVELKSADDAIQQFDKVAETKIMEKNRQRRDAIVTEIRAVVDARARTHSYTAVLDISGDSQNFTPFVLYYSGDNDLTDEVLKALNATAPPVPTDTEKPAGVKLNEK